MPHNTSKGPRVHLVITSCLAVAGLCVSPYAILLVTGGGTGANLELTNEIVLWLLSGFFFLGAGLVFFRGKTAVGRKKIAFGFATAILMGLMVELSLQAIFWTANIVRHAGKEKLPILHHSACKGKPWARQMMHEWEEALPRYEPFVGWRRPRYKGGYVNVDSHGLRKTWNPASFSETPKRVYMFGGSTMWGQYARDDCTIASWASKKLNAVGTECMVYNYGESGYVILQEIVQLMLLLRDGHRPDYVIFYDGVNDVYATYQAGKAGAVQNTFRMRATFHAGTISFWGRRWLDFKSFIQDNCLTYKAIKRIAETVEGKREGREVAADYGERAIGRLASEEVEQYAKSLALIENLAKVYNFRYTCFWQPVAFVEDQLTEEEAGSDPRLKDERLAELFTQVYALVRQQPLRNYVDISDVFRSHKESVYFDFCHLTEEGNEMIADKIVEMILPVLRADRSTTSNALTPGDSPKVHRINMASPYE